MTAEHVCQTLFYILGFPLATDMRLFRQRTFGDWQPVLDDVQAELSKLADAAFPSN